MRPTFLAFQTASRALAASQVSLDVTGNNIANANTEGYSRQRVDISSISSTGYDMKYMVPGAKAGVGVEVTGIRQIRDPFLDLRYRSENAENGKLSTIISGLSDLEGIYDETENPGLQTELSNFLNQLQELSKSPTSKDISQIVRTAAQRLTQVMNIYSNQTTQVRDQQIYGLDSIVVNNDFNSLVKNIASLNSQIREDQTYGEIPNELMDRRNLLLDQLSNIANIKVTVKPEKISDGLSIERMTVDLYDQNTGTSVGLIDNDLYNTLSVDDSKETLGILINSSFDPHETKDITDHFTSGVIKGYLDVINGKGTYAASPTENSFRGTLYYKSAMDTFAAKFANVFNSINSTVDTSVTPSVTTLKPLFQSSGDGTAAITASNIRISNEWLADSSFITTTKDANSSSGGSDNVLKMIQAMSAKNTFNSDPADPNSTVFEGTYNQYMTGLVGELALDVNLNQNFSDTSSNVLNNLTSARESISGVSMDEEGINLLAYQKSYNAAARFLTTLDEAVDTLINKMGIVGR